MTTALRLVWSDPPRWERRILAADRPSTTNVDVAWVDANRAYFSLEVPALLEVTVEPGGGLSTPRELPLPLRLGPVTAVLVENNQLSIASAEGSAVIHSRPLNEPDRWANPIRAHPIRLLRMTSWLGGIAGAGGGWIDITRSTGVGEDVVACGLRPNEGQDDLNEVVALNPRVLMIGGRLSPSAVPQIYRLDSPAD